MIKTIKLDKENSIKINTSARWYTIYREQFGHDIFAQLLPFVASVADIFANIAGNIAECGTIEEALASIDENDISSALSELAAVEITALYNIIWAMSVNAAYRDGSEILAPGEWQDKFDVFPLDIVLPEVGKAIVQSSVSAKNLRRLRSVTKNAKDKVQKIATQAQSTVSTESSSQQSTED